MMSSISWNYNGGGIHRIPPPFYFIALILKSCLELKGSTPFALPATTSNLRAEPEIDRLSVFKDLSPFTSLLVKF
jgi:hypothetical protein